MPNKQNNHQQPSKEELKATEEVAIKAAEELEGRQTIPLDEEEPVESEDSGNYISTDSPPSDSQLPEEAPAEPIPADVEQQEEQADPSKELYKKKFSASSRENQKINARIE